MSEINKNLLGHVFGGVNYYVEYNADTGSIGVGFQISF